MKRSQLAQLPPGPSLPTAIQMMATWTRPAASLERLRHYGKRITVRLPFQPPFVMLWDAADIKEVFTAPPDVLHPGEGASILAPLVGHNSVILLDEQAHLEQRRLLLPAFHGERMQAFAAVMRGIAEASLATWPVGQPFALHPLMQSITLDVILRTVFGLEHGAQHKKLRAQLIQLLEILTKPILMIPGMLGIDPFRVKWLPVTKLKADIDVALYRIIASRRDERRGTDVLSMMLDARDDKGEPMSDVEIRDELMTLLLAGHETTATSLAWTFDQLLSHPRVLDKLRDELAAGKEEYLDCVIRETLRVRPIVPLVGRVVAKPFQLGKWLLPVGTRIAPSIYLSGMRPSAYKDPKKFDPDRWIGVKPDPYTWLPFGGGVRRCIGMAFAQFEMRIVIQTIVQRARLRLVGGPAHVVRRGITLAPSEGRRVIVAERAQVAAAS